MITSEQLAQMADILRSKALDGTLTEADTLFSMASANLHMAMILDDIRDILLEMRNEI